MSYIMLLLFCAVGCYGIFKNRNIGALIIFYSMIAPCISFGGRRFDSTYFFVPLMVMAVVVKSRKIRKYKVLQEFILMTLIWIIMYCLGWVLNAMVSPNSFVISILGLLKSILAIYLCFIASKCENINELQRTIGKGLEYTVYANVIAVILQWLIPTKMYDICYKLYYSADTTGYTNYELINSWGSGFYNGRYYRYFGLFETPMIFSCVMILVIAFFVIQITSRRKYFQHPLLIVSMSIFLGISAQCKIFFLMMPVFLLLYVVYNLKKLTHQKIIIYAIIGILGVFVIMFLEQISSISTFRYFRYLADPLSAFATRFSSEGDQQGYIYQTLQIAMDNILTGVGPVSIQGESIADSSYVVLFHNGGIIAVLAMVFYYIKSFKSNFKQKDGDLNILIIVFAIMGASRTVMLSSAILVVIIFYIIENKRLKIMNFKESVT